MKVWVAATSFADMMDCRAGGIVRVSDPTTPYSFTVPGMAPVSGSGAWLNNADFPLDYDERDAKV